MKASNLRPARPPDFEPTIPGLLKALKQRYGARDALVGASGRVSFEDIEARSARLAKGLLASGLAKGAHVGLLMPNGPDFAIAFMAITRIGGVVVPLSTMLQAPELAWQTKHADLQALLVASSYRNHDYVARLEAALPDLKLQRAGHIRLQDAPFLRTILVWEGSDRSWAVSGADALVSAAESERSLTDAFLRSVEGAVVPADPLCIIYTSGSTAEPKGVVHGHGPLLRYAYQMGHDYWPLTGEDRIVSQRAFFWIAGLVALFQSLMLGACFITPADGSGATLLSLIENENATAVAGDEVWLKALRCDSTILAAGYQVVRLNMASAGIAKSDGERLIFLNAVRAEREPAPKHAPDDLFPRSFGMTETCGSHTAGRSNTLLPPDRPRRSGKPVPGIELKIVDPGSDQVVAADEDGELQVRGYSLMLGLHKKERDDVFTSDGFYRTGDIGRFDDAGYLQFSHRLGDMIKIKGANVAPLEVEAALDSLSGVERSAVVSISEREGDGEMLVAAVRMLPGAAFDESVMQAELRKRLSVFKVPKFIVDLQGREFPTTGSGKIKKPALKSLLQETFAKELSGRTIVQRAASNDEV